MYHPYLFDADARRCLAFVRMGSVNVAQDTAAAAAAAVELGQDSSCRFQDLRLQLVADNEAAVEQYLCRLVVEVLPLPHVELDLPWLLAVQDSQSGRCQ